MSTDGKLKRIKGGRYEAPDLGLEIVKEEGHPAWSIFPSDSPVGLAEFAVYAYSLDDARRLIGHLRSAISERET